MAGLPFGGVSFFDGDTLLGTLSLDGSGSASYSTAELDTGTHAITATFNANGPYGSSGSLPLTISITATPTAAVVTLTSLERQAATTSLTSALVATVSAANAATEGKVTFLDNGAILGTVALDGSSVARLAVVQISSGAHTFTASYSGSGELAPSASPVLNERWPASGPAFAMQLQPSANANERAPAFRITISPFGIFQQTVQLSCPSGLPPGYTCEFSPSAVAGAGVSSLVIVSSAKAAGPMFLPMLRAWCTLLSVCAFLLGVSWRRHPRLVLALGACSMLVALEGCGSVSSSTELRMFVVTVEAATGSGADAIVHTEQIPVRLRVAK
jgi:hypothetical protein